MAGDMEVQVVGTTTIHASSSPTATSALPFTIFDKYASDMHIAVLYAFAPPTASNAAIQEGLARTLLYFPKLTGRLGMDGFGHPCIHVGGSGGGALLMEATVTSELADHVPLEPSPGLLRLHPPTEGAQHLLQLQLNRFRCGGLVVGATAHHRVADGQAMSSFFVAWGKSVRGLAVDPLPILDFSQWLRPRCPPRCEFQHWGIEFSRPGQPISNNYSSLPTPSSAGNIHNIRLHYSSEFLEKSLKAQMRARYTTFVSLLAHLWRKITMARGLTGEQITEVSVAVNGRRRHKPPVPPEFFGNLVINACPRARAGELLEGGVEGAARLIYEAIRGIGDEYLRSLVDFGAMYEGEELRPVYADAGISVYPNLEVDSWLGFRFHELDFGGGGRLCAFAPTWIAAEGVLVLHPSLGGGGSGVDVVVTLFEEHAKLLQEMSHSLP